MKVSSWEYSRDKLICIGMNFSRNHLQGKGNAWKYTGTRAEGEPGRGAIFYFTLPAYNERGVLKREKSDKKQLNKERPI
jgi:hypothetical protein